MAGEPEGSNAMGDALWVLGILGILVALWFASGGPGKADLRGLFLSPPPPLGTGDAYGPQVGTTSQATQEQQQQQQEQQFNNAQVAPPESLPDSSSY